jgi:hypothetical protein
MLAVGFAVERKEVIPVEERIDAEFFGADPTVAHLGVRCVVGMGLQTDADLVGMGHRLLLVTNGPIVGSLPPAISIWQQLYGLQ